MTPIAVKARVLYYASGPWPKEIVLMPGAEFPWLKLTGKKLVMTLENGSAEYRWSSDEGPRFGSIYDYVSGTYEALLND